MKLNPCCLLLLVSCMSCQKSIPRNEVPTRGAELSVRDASFLEDSSTTYTGLNEALRNGHLNFAELHDVELPEATQALVTGLQLVKEGRNDKAFTHFQELMSSRSDPAIVSLAASFVANLLYDRGDYASLSTMLGQSDDVGARLVRLLSSFPKQVVADRDTGAGLNELRVGQRGHPSVQVRIRGREEFWYFDTGASQSVIAASVASELGVLPVEAEGLEVSTSTTHAPPARVGLVKELELGGVRVFNVPVLIYDDADLTFDLDGGGSITIRGIVGWPIIRELRAELDYVGGRYTAKLSTPRDHPGRNFSWLGYPMVSLHSDGGLPLTFGLDTGSWNTSITERILKKLSFGSVRDDVARIGGVGGYVDAEVKVVDELNLVLGNARATLEEVQTEEAAGAEHLVFFLADGVLGSDIAQEGTLTLDYKNGHLKLQSAQ